MHPFQFNGHWTTELSLPLIAQRLDEPRFFYPGKRDGVYPMDIMDSEDAAPDPTPAQMAAIHFLQENQDALLEAIFVCFRDRIYPFVQQEWGVSPEDDPDLFPPFETAADLRKVAGLEYIHVYPTAKDGLAYKTLIFESVLNAWAITFHGLTLIHFSSGRNLEADEAILEHAGPEAQARAAERSEQYEEIEAQKQAAIRTNGPYLPDPRYGTLKPWQETANRHHPFWLLHQDDLEGLKALLTDPRFEAYLNTDEMLSVATHHQKQAFIDLLSNKDTIEDIYPALCAAIDNADLATMQRLLPKDADLNAQRGQESYLFKLMGGWYAHAGDPARVAVYREAIALFIAQGANPYLQERWSRNAFYILLKMDNTALRAEIEAWVTALAEQYGRAPDTDIPPNDVAARARFLLGKQ